MRNRPRKNLRRFFVSALAIAIAIEPLAAPAYALRTLGPAETPDTLAGLEEALGAAKHKGIRPTRELSNTLRTGSAVAAVSEVRQLDRDIGAVGGLMARVQQERLDWASYQQRRLSAWFGAAQHQHQAMVDKGLIRAPDYDSQQEAVLQRRAEQTRLVVENIVQVVPNFRDLVTGAVRVLERAADGNRVYTFDPPAELLNQIVRIQDPTGRTDFLVAFEIMERGEGYLYLLLGLADSLRGRNPGFLPALLTNAGVELFLLEQWERFLVLEAVQRYLLQRQVSPGDLQAIYQELAHIIAEDMERIALGIRVEDPGFIAPDSPLDEAIAEFTRQRVSRPAAPAPAAPPELPGGPPALRFEPPRVEPRAEPPREATEATVDERVTNAWREWVGRVDHVRHPLWDDDGQPVGLPTAEELAAELRVASNTLRGYLSRVRGPGNTHRYPTRRARGDHAVRMLAEWITAYNRAHPESAMTQTSGQLAQIYDPVAAMVLVAPVEAQRFGRLVQAVAAGGISAEHARSGIDALNRLFEFVGGIPAIPIPLPAPAPAQPAPALPVPPAAQPPPAPAAAPVARPPAAPAPAALAALPPDEDPAASQITLVTPPRFRPVETPQAVLDMTGTSNTRKLYEAYLQWINDPRHHGVPPTTDDLRRGEMKKWNDAKFERVAQERRRIVPQDEKFPLHVLPANAHRDVKKLVAAYLAQRSQAAGMEEVTAPEGWEGAKLKRVVQDHWVELQRIAGDDPRLRNLLETIARTPVSRIAVKPKPVPPAPAPEPEAPPAPPQEPAPPPAPPAAPPTAAPAAPPAVAPRPLPTRVQELVATYLQLYDTPERILGEWNDLLQDVTRQLPSSAASAGERRREEAEADRILRTFFVQQAGQFMDGFCASPPGWARNWETVENHLGSFPDQPLTAWLTSPVNYRGIFREQLGRKSAELKRTYLEATTRPSPPAGGAASLQRPTTSGRPQLIAEMFRSMEEANRSLPANDLLDLAALGGEAGLRALIDPRNGGTGRSGEQRALLADDVLRVSLGALQRPPPGQDPVGIIKNAIIRSYKKASAKERGRGGVKGHKDEHEDRRRYGERAARVQVAGFILTHRDLLEMYAGPNGLFRGQEGEALRDEVRVLRGLLAEGKLDTLFEAEAGTRRAASETGFVDWFELLGLTWQIRMKEIVVRGLPNVKAFPTVSQVEARARDMRDSNQLKSSQLGDLLRTIKKGNSPYPNYIRAWIQHHHPDKLQAGLEEQEPLRPDLPLVANELYRFGDLFQRYFSGGHLGEYAHHGWSKFMAEVKERDEYAYNLFLHLGEPIGFWVHGDLLLHKPSGGVFLVTGKPGAGKSLFSAVAVSSRARGWAEPDLRSEWEYLVNDTVLVLKAGNELLAGLPPSARIKDLSTRYPLPTAIRTGDPTEYYKVRISERGHFGRLAGIFWLTQERLPSGARWTLRDVLGSETFAVKVWPRPFAERFRKIPVRRLYIGRQVTPERLAPRVNRVSVWAKKVAGPQAGLEETKLLQVGHPDYDKAIASPIREGSEPVDVVSGPLLKFLQDLPPGRRVRVRVVPGSVGEAKGWAEVGLAPLTRDSGELWTQALERMEWPVQANVGGEAEPEFCRVQFNPPLVLETGNPDLADPVTIVELTVVPKGVSRFSGVGVEISLESREKFVKDVRKAYRRWDAVELVGIPMGVIEKEELVSWLRDAGGAGGRGWDEVIVTESEEVQERAARAAAAAAQQRAKADQERRDRIARVVGQIQPDVQAAREDLRGRLDAMVGDLGRYLDGGRLDYLRQRVEELDAGRLIGGVATPGSEPEGWVAEARGRLSREQQEIAGEIAGFPDHWPGRQGMEDALGHLLADFEELEGRVSPDSPLPDAQLRELFLGGKARRAGWTPARVAQFLRESRRMRDLVARRLPECTWFPTVRLEAEGTTPLYPESLSKPDAERALVLAVSGQEARETLRISPFLLLSALGARLFMDERFGTRPEAQDWSTEVLILDAGYAAETLNEHPWLEVADPSQIVPASALFQRIARGETKYLLDEAVRWAGGQLVTARMAVLLGGEEAREGMLAAMGPSSFGSVAERIRRGQSPRQLIAGVGQEITRIVGKIPTEVGPREGEKILRARLQEMGKRVREGGVSPPPAHIELFGRIWQDVGDLFALAVFRAALSEIPGSELAASGLDALAEELSNDLAALRDESDRRGLGLLVPAWGRVDWMSGYRQVADQFGSFARQLRIRGLQAGLEEDAFRNILAKRGRVVLNGFTYQRPDGRQEMVPVEGDPFVERLIQEGAIAPGADRIIVVLNRPAAAIETPRRLFTQVTLGALPTGMDPAKQVVGVSKEPVEARESLAGITDQDVLFVDAGSVSEEEMWGLIPEGRKPIIVRISDADAARLKEAHQIDALIQEAERQPDRAVSVHSIQESADYKVAVLTAA